MKSTRLLVIALAVAVATTGVAAAAGASSTNGQGNGHGDEPHAGAAGTSVDVTRTNESVVLTVRTHGEPLQGVTVSADDEELGTTDENGSVELPSDVGGELTLSFQGSLEGHVVLDVGGDSIRVVDREFPRAAEAMGAEAADAVSKTTGNPATNDTDGGAGTQSDARAHENQRPTDADDRGASSGGADAGQGPPTEMPEQVPDRVTEIHRTIQSFIDGSLEGPLGEALSGIAGGDASQTGRDAGQSDQAASESGQPSHAGTDAGQGSTAGSPGQAA
jgi:hypothetical protein